MLKEVSGVKQSNISLSSFENYFKAINNPDNRFFTPDDDKIDFINRYETNEFKIMFHELNTQISADEINLAIKQLSTNKSGRPDLLLNVFFIEGKGTLLPVLHALFNKLFETGHFPDRWSEGYVIPLHKKGNINNVENYRGITLLSALGKLFTGVINNRLKSWDEMYNVYIEAQAGFKSNMSTADNIFVISGLISHVLNQGRQLFTLFVDFPKAFDYVVRDNLWYKMIQLGLRGNILDIVKSIYESVKSRVKCNNELSDEFPCLLGVRQGECLSPFLFSIFINDLEDMFVPRETMFYYNGQIIEIVNKFNYLGIVFTSGGSLSSSQNTLSGQAQKASFKLNKYLHKFTYIPPKT
jgi:hypothetical protein